MTFSQPADDGLRRPSFDVAIIGGGIVGCAIARDAAGRGLSVFLCEEGDLGSGATQSAGGLVHAGLDLVAHGHWRLLRRNARERDLLCRSAPFAVRHQAFVLPYHARLWPERALNVGLAAYDRASRSGMPRSRRIIRADEGNGAFGALQDHFEVAYEIHDCVADGARLAVLNAVDANARGALIVPRHRCVVAEREGVRWSVSLESEDAERRFQVRARVLVNATGAVAGDTAAHVIHAAPQDPNIAWRRTKSVYVRRRPGETTAYVLPNPDGRLIYAVPVAGDLLRIVSEGEPASAGDDAMPDRRDVADLCDIVGQYFAEPPGVEDVVRVEGAVTGATSGTEGYYVTSDAPEGLAPVVTACGGSLTTHRLVAEKAVDMIAEALKAGEGWTAGHPLPGVAGLPEDGLDGLTDRLEHERPFAGRELVRRLVARYGARAGDVLSGAHDRASLGAWFGAWLTEREVRFLCEQEWAETASDVLWRRTRLGLELDPDGVARLEAWFAARIPVHPEADVVRPRVGAAV